MNPDPLSEEQFGRELYRLASAPRRFIPARLLLSSASTHAPRQTTAAGSGARAVQLCCDDRHTLSRGHGGVMSKFERLLEAGSTELPDCRCTAEMNLMAIVPVAGGDTEIGIFRCPNRRHELRLTAWRNDVSAA